MKRVSDLFSIVKELRLPPDEFAVFGSGPLIIRDIVPLANDLDIVCRGAAWQHVSSIGELSYVEEQDVTIASIHDGQISFGTRWGIGDFDTDHLIDTAENIDGLPFVRLEHVVAYKLISGRSKDSRHIAALQASEFAFEL